VASRFFADSHSRKHSVLAEISCPNLKGAVPKAVEKTLTGQPFLYGVCFLVKN
jgi:hypothetical protein